MFGGLVAGAIMILAPSSSAGQAGMSRLADGVLMYLGVMPTEAILEHQAFYPGHVDEGVPSGKNVYHVMLALFDRATGERITDADVPARVSPLGLVGSRKGLHTLTEAGALTYCEYFTHSPHDRYVIHVTVRRPQASQVVEANFDYPLSESARRSAPACGADLGRPGCGARPRHRRSRSRAGGFGADGVGPRAQHLGVAEAPGVAQKRGVILQCRRQARVFARLLPGRDRALE